MLEESVQRVRARVREYNQQNPELPLGISIGSAVNSNGGNNIYELFKQADNNMYREKLRRKQSARSAIVQTLMKGWTRGDPV